MPPVIRLLGVVDFPGGPVGEEVELVALDEVIVGGLVLPGCPVVVPVG